MLTHVAEPLAAADPDEHPDLRAHVARPPLGTRHVALLHVVDAKQVAEHIASRAPTRKRNTSCGTIGES